MFKKDLEKDKSIVKKSIEKKKINPNISNVVLNESISPELRSVVEIVNEIRKLFVDNYYIKDSDIIDIVFATAFSSILPGDPVWLVVVAQSSGLKTEIIRSFGEAPNEYVHPSSKITENAIASGSESRKKGFSLADKINGKIWTIKDLTTLLESRVEKVQAIAASMREIYDGYISVDSGLEGGSKNIQCKTTLIAAVTPDPIEKTKVFKAEIGERVLYMRIPIMDYDGKAKLKEALKQSDTENSDTRKKISDKVFDFLNLLETCSELENLDTEKLDESTIDLLFNFADFIATLRTSVTFDFKGNEIEHVNTSESPARLYKQLVKLSFALKHIRGTSVNDTNVLNSISKVVMDTIIPGKRIICLTPFIENYPKNEEIHNTEIIKFLETFSVSKYVTVKMLKELEVLNVIKSTKGGKGSRVWKIDDDFFNEHNNVFDILSKNNCYSNI